MKPQVKYILAAFLVGLFTGGLLVRMAHPIFWHRHMAPEKRREHMFDRFSHDLKLSPEQRDDVKKIFDASREEMTVVMKDCGPRFADIRRKTNEEIRKRLTPDQQTKFDKLNAEREQRIKERGHWMP